VNLAWNRFGEIGDALWCIVNFNLGWTEFYISITDWKWNSLLFIFNHQYQNIIFEEVSLTLSRPPATIVKHALYLQILAVLTQKTSNCFFYYFFWGYVPLGVWARGVINPGYLVIEVLMQKTLVSSFSQGWYLQVLWISLRYTSKLMIYGFFNFFLCFGRRSSRKSGAKGLNVQSRKK
jgi:hypothetical protein